MRKIEDLFQIVIIKKIMFMKFPIKLFLLTKIKSIRLLEINGMIMIKKTLMKKKSSLSFKKNGI